MKPKLTQVRDISKKINKDTGDDAGIFMGDCKYYFYLTKYFNTHNALRPEASIRMRHSKKILSMKH